VVLLTYTLCSRRLPLGGIDNCFLGVGGLIGPTQLQCIRSRGCFVLMGPNFGFGNGGFVAFPLFACLASGRCPTLFREFWESSESIVGNMYIVFMILLCDFSLSLSYVCLAFCPYPHGTESVDF